MMECLILGDSIAVGVHQQRTECSAYATGGINSWQFNRKYPREFFSDYVIISLGSNDHKGVKTLEELTALRKRVKANARVVWILPAENLAASGVSIEKIQSYVVQVAKANGDTVLPIPSLSPDKIHPSGKGYKELARAIK
jgi:lysophospholipase L1-like esterase